MSPEILSDQNLVPSPRRWKTVAITFKAASGLLLLTALVLATVLALRGSETEAQEINQADYRRLMREMTTLIARCKEEEDNARGLYLSSRLDRLLLRLAEAENAQRGYLLTGDVHLRGGYESAARRADGDLKRLTELKEDSLDLPKILQPLRQAVTARLDNLRRSLLGQDKGPQAVPPKDLGLREMDEVRRQVSRIKKAIRAAYGAS
jgi:CHASE3 domain sensor protein